ncbi:hypothetical protein CHS0354_041420 [Potamilus streckersoni]|uniref:TIR domain-containing protein n=1 Tax=Potamilus streckersoni TaxID=2493646 RepID=A0AAE0T9W0_9BIVA|nr:hypothetical protein CHS0354_041420 [Potamilus streckersoni]
MNTFLWIPSAIVIITTYAVHVRALTCMITLCSIPNICGNGRECRTNPDTCEKECVCMDNVTHKDCRAAIVNQSINSPVTSPRTGTTERFGDISTRNASVTNTPLSQSTDCSQNYTKNIQPCQGGLPCFYGYCVVDNVSRTARCKCYPRVTGDLCNEICCLDCGPYGECGVNVEDSTQYCNCFLNYTGERCETPRPKENTDNPEHVQKETWYLWLVGVCAVTLFVLLLLLIILPYLMWKHRVILIMKIVHYFQSYEDQDDRIWDAFVSYRSDPVDEEFVLRKLYNTLEKEMGFKLNLHFKDFAVGETIANNIIQAVQNSRRTILVMSKNYVKSEFTRFEYQCAQNEMLQRKHRIIPILLEDITEIKDTIDPTLKVILNSVTYIMWPGEDNPKELNKFWKRLELSMPKIRKVKDERTSVKENVAVFPESIQIYTIKDNKHSDVIKMTENKSIDEGEHQHVMKKDYTNTVDTSDLNTRLSTFLSNYQK